LNCYPNPTSDVLTINYTTNEQVAIISVYDSFGKIVKIQKTNLPNLKDLADFEYSKRAELRVDDLSCGTYFISVTDNKFQVIGSSKVIKK